MTDFYQPQYDQSADNPFARDGDAKLIRRGYWLDMSDASLVLAMTKGVGAALGNAHKRAHLKDIGRAELIDRVCVVEILPPQD